MLPRIHSLVFPPGCPLLQPLLHGIIKTGTPRKRPRYIKNETGRLLAETCRFSLEYPPVSVQAPTTSARKRGGGKTFVDFSCTISINTPQRPVFANGKGGGTKKRDRQCLSPSLSILDKKDTAPNPPPRLPSAPNPARRIGAESEEIPAIAQFSAKPETERWREFLSWCRWWDSNPHGVATGGF